ncbi:MAG: UDP-glucose 4-epimerase [Geminicoccaceae bacterium]|nr:UDP-glucose 4-epimerase [Geminicoccaceae bacterium]
MQSSGALEPLHPQSDSVVARGSGRNAIRILVTGGAGFIGKHLVELLIANGREVLVLDDLSVGRDAHIPAGCGFRQVDLAVWSVAEAASLLCDFRPQAVVHLAAMHFIPDCMADPERTFAVNVGATHTLVEALAHHPVEHLVFASTLDVYGTADVVHVEDEPAAPANVYGLSKLLGEQLVAYATRCEHCRSGIALRLANAYGPDETNPHLVPDTIARLRDRATAQLRMGYLGATRDFVFVKDVAAAIAASVRRDLPGYTCLNVGTGKPTPVREIVALLQAEAGDHRMILEDPATFRKFDRRSLTPDVRRIREVLGWRASWSLPDGIEATVRAAFQEPG